MCGIVGVAGNLNAREKDMFQSLLTVCQLRGKHSTGAITVNNSDKYDYVKRLGTPEFLIETKEYDRKIHSPLSKALIGHCRHATAGKVNMLNAHPFEHGHICGVHNGTLQGVYNMERFREFDVDSDWLYWYISEYGIEETIRNIDSDGAWALVWWDEKQETLNFLKNEKRPLYFTYSKGMNQMFWASEPWMLYMVERKIDLWDGGDSKLKFFSLPNDTLWSFKVNAYGKDGPDTFTLKEMVEIKGKEVRSYQGNFHGYGGYSSGVHWKGGEVADPFLNDKVDDVGKNNVVHLPSLVHTHTAGGSSSIGSTTQASKTSSSSTSGQSMVSKSSSGTGQQSHLKPRPTLSLSQSENKESSLKDCSDSNGSCGKASKKLVSMRTVAGMSFITDETSGKEFGEARFDELTEGKCCFCKRPIGGLEEVHEIFVETVNDTPSYEEVRFVCKPCVTPVMVA